MERTYQGDRWCVSTQFTPLIQDSGQLPGSIQYESNGGNDEAQCILKIVNVKAKHCNGFENPQ